MAETKMVPVPEEFQLIDRYWKASNYLAVGQVRSKISKSVSEEAI
jgi:phosphoketolase